METISRRNFILTTAAMLACPVYTDAFSLFDKSDNAAEKDDIRGHIFKNDAPQELWKWSHEGCHYKKLDGKRVVCGICPNRCLLEPGDRSVCRSKINQDGTLYSLTYGNPCAVNIDPIEKKPLYHFKPKTSAFSIATTGCNLRCLNCQNWEISQAKPEDVRHYDLFPADVVAAAQKASAQSIAYTYSEATTFFEYMRATARIATRNKIHNLLISNGYINKTPLLDLCGVLSAANINLKSFQDATYRKLNGGRLEPVLRTLRTLHEQHVHLEITTLVIPHYTDMPEMVKRMAAWILEHIGPDHPWHFLRFAPLYKLDRLPPTPISVLETFRDIALQEGIHYAYVGNVPSHPGNNTYCHSCHKLLIERRGYVIPTFNIDNGKCKFCHTVIPGVWQS